jgi:hypothetical protein
MYTLSEERNEENCLMANIMVYSRSLRIAKSLIPIILNSRRVLQRQRDGYSDITKICSLQSRINPGLKD